MDHSEFKAFTSDTFDLCFKVLGIKGDDYSPEIGNRLNQFYQIARMRLISPVAAVELAGLTKHISRMYMLIDKANDGELAPLEEWDKNLIDIINYVILLRAVVKQLETPTGGLTKL